MLSKPNNNPLRLNLTNLTLYDKTQQLEDNEDDLNMNMNFQDPPPPPSPNKFRKDAKENERDLTVEPTITQRKLHEQLQKEATINSLKLCNSQRQQVLVDNPNLHRKLPNQLQDLLSSKEWRNPQSHFRIKTPIRQATLELCQNNERTFLKRKQQTLQQLNMKIREQEVSDLSESMSFSILRSHTFTASQSDMDKLDPRIRSAYSKASVITTASSRRSHRHLQENDLESKRNKAFEIENSLRHKQHSNNKHVLHRWFHNKGHYPTCEHTSYSAIPRRQPVEINGPIQMSIYSQKGPFLKPLMGKHINKTDGGVYTLTNQNNMGNISERYKRIKQKQNQMLTLNEKQNSLVCKFVAM